MEQRGPLQPKSLKLTKDIVRDSLTYDYNDPPDQWAMDWMTWWNTLAPRIDWHIGRIGAVMEPNPDIEEVAVTTTLYASQDAGGVPFCIQQVCEVFVWSDEDRARRALSSMMVSTMLATMRTVVRLMRRRQRHGLDPWLQPAMFRHRNREGVRHANL